MYSSYELINLSFVVLFLLGALFLFYRSFRLRRSLKPAASEPSSVDEYSLVSIAVPRNNDRTPQAAEQMFAALHGIFRAGVNSQQRISFEIATRNQTITFFVYVPTSLKDFVVSQVYAQYPHVEMTDIALNDDYAQLPEGLHAAGTELMLKKPHVYPVKSFLNFEVDPLSSITGVMTSVTNGEDLWFQLIVEPVDDDWQEAGEKEIKNIKDPPKKEKGWAELVSEKTLLFIMDFFRVVATGKVAEPEKKEEKKDKTELTGSQQQAIKGIEEKITKLGFNTTIRLTAVGKDPTFTQARLEQLVGGFKQYNSLSLNSFITGDISTDETAVSTYRSRNLGVSPMIFNITELASLYHFPSETVATPSIAWAGAKKGEPPANLPLVGTLPPDELTVFAQTNYRSRIQKFGIKKKDRRLHMYIIGKTGTGKSTLMENMIFDDIREGRGVAVVDPHGELIDHVLEFIPESRINDVVYFSPADYHYPLGFNVLEYVEPEFRNVVASGVVGIFKKIFGESWGPRLEYILRNAILALLEVPNSTLLGVMRLMSDNAYRRQVISEVHDPVVKDFFINEFEKYEPKFRQEAIAPIQNKVGQFTSSSTIRNIIGQPKSAMDIREIMDSGKILLADLSTGKIGEDNSALLGAMLITKIQLSAMGRTNMLEDDRRDFYLYVDEFQNFATDSFATILSEARKYRLNLVMINQYINQMPETVANAVFGNVGTMVAFRVGAGDADALQKEFEPVFETNDLVNLPNRQIYLKMAVDGVTMPAFSASTLPPPTEKANLRDRVVEASRKQYATPRSDVEDYITDWSAPINLNSEPRQPGKQDYERVVTTIAPAELAKGVGNGGESNQDSTTSLAAHGSVQVLTDRFSHSWYAVKEEQPAKIGESPLLPPVPTAAPLPIIAPTEPIALVVPTNTDIATEDRGEASGKAVDSLITWEKASELGLKLPNGQGSYQAKPHDGFEPIDEL